MTRDRIVYLLSLLFDGNQVDFDHSVTKQELQLLVEHYRFLRWDRYARDYVLTDRGYAYLYNFPMPN